MNANECQLRLIFSPELLPSDRTKQTRRVGATLHGKMHLCLNQSLAVVFLFPFFFSWRFQKKTHRQKSIQKQITFPRAEADGFFEQCRGR